MYTYKILDLPPVPDELVKQAYEIYHADVKAKTNIADWHKYEGYAEYRHREVIHTDGTKFKTTGTARYRVSDEFEAWARDMFKPSFTLAGLSVMDVDYSKTMAPHVDTSRNYTIQYLLDTGGSNVETTFWQEKGKPITRPDLRQNYNPDDVIKDYRDLIELDRFRIPAGVWVSLHSSILHSIENLESPRIAFQLGTDNEPEGVPCTYVSTINT